MEIKHISLKLASLCVDLLFSLLFIPLVIMLPVDRWIVSQTNFTICLIAYIYALYFAYRKLSPVSLFVRKKYAVIVVALIIMVAVTEALGNFPHTGHSLSPLTEHVRHNLRRQLVWFFYLIITGFSLAIDLLFELFKQIISRQSIEAEKNKAELALYKSQINPHFLFNTLNSLYALVISKSEKTESAFIRFSGILKYMYSKSQSDMVGIEDEISYIEQYIELQKLRLNDHTHVEFVRDIKNTGIKIPSMLLITFIENAFKYGTSSDEDCLISIDIMSDEKSFHFKSVNDIMRENPEELPGIGLKNCRKRLELLYSGRFKLTYGKHEGKYVTELTIFFNKTNRT